MTGLWALVKRNTKLYFKDKGMFISSLITPHNTACFIFNIFEKGV